MLVAIFLLGIAAMRSVEQQEHVNLTATIDADIAGLVDVMAQGDVAELQQRIADRTAFAASIPAFRKSPSWLQPESPCCCAPPDCGVG
jgi:hypothetical protein